MEEKPKLLACSDVLIETKDGILLIKRRFDPFKNHWGIPGGMLEVGKESVEETALREAKEETSLDVKKGDLILLGVYSDPKRDPRGHLITHAYVVKTHGGIAKAGNEAKEIKFFRELPENLVPAHKQILEDYFKWKQKNEN